MIRAVLFDLDGVLVDSFEVWWQLIAELAMSRGHARASRLRFVATFGQSVDDDLREFFPGERSEAIVRAYDEQFLEHVAHLSVMAGAVSVLDSLRRSGVRSCVVTNTPSTLARRIVDHAGLRPGGIVGSCDVKAAKPDPAMIRLGCARCDVTSDEALVVGDSDYDRAAAEAAGVRFVGFRRPGAARIERLEELENLVRIEALLAG